MYLFSLLQSGITIANQIADLKQNHSEEIQSLRTQFETEIRDAVKRTKTGPQKLEDGYRKEISQNDTTESQEDTFNPGKLR